MAGRYHEVIKRAFELVQKVANDKAHYGPIEDMSRSDREEKMWEEYGEYAGEKEDLRWRETDRAAEEGAHLLWAIIIDMYCEGLLPEPMPHFPPPDEYIKLPEDKPTFKWEGSPYFGRAHRDDLRASEGQMDPGPRASDSSASVKPSGTSQEDLA